MVIVTFTLTPSSLTSNITSIISTPSPVNPIIAAKVLEPNLARSEQSLTTTDMLDEASKINHEDENYIVPCHREYFDNLYDVEGVDEKHADFHDYLAKSNTAEDKLAFILFASHTQKKPKIDLLYNYLQVYPNHQLASMEMIIQCSETIEHSACRQGLFEQAEKIDGDNAALWLRIANYYAANSDKQATLSAIRKANKATFFEDYYYQNFALYMKVSQGTLDVSYPLKIVGGFGLLAAKNISIFDVSNFCTLADMQVIEKNQACLTLGKKMEEKGQNMVINRIGMMIQERVHQAEGNDKLKAQLKARQDTFNNTFEFKLQDQASHLMMADKKLFHYWLNNALNYGEATAVNMLIKEAITLSKNPHYNPCANE